MSVNFNGLQLQMGSLSTENPKILASMGDALNPGNHGDNNSESKEMYTFINYTKDKKTLLDVGSQFGSFSYSFIGNDSNKQAYAFDGGDLPFLFTTQVKAINNLHNLHMFKFLVGDKNEKVRCHQEELQSLALDGTDTNFMFTIDMICHLYNIEPDVIKMDIEGCEFNALRGANNTILKYQPTLFMEIHPKFMDMYQTTITDIISFIDSINYKVLDFDLNEIENYASVLEQEQADSNRSIWVPR